MEKAVREGSFREDLYYRLNVVTIKIPPLRERKEDIPLLTNHFLHKFSIANSRSIDNISSEAMKAIINYNWPGNIRELQNIIEQAVVICKENEIGIEDLPDIIKNVITKTGDETTARTLDEFEKQHITKILNNNLWNISKTANELGIDRVTLYNKIKKYKIEKNV